MSLTKSLNPADRLGVYKTLADVPDRYRVHHHADAYADRETWQTFCEEHEYARGDYEGHRMEVDRAGDRWKTYMADRKRHHALATPEDIEVWCAELREEYSLRRTHEHWLRINRFYSWLVWHTDHPHVYNPVLMAANMDGAAGEVWTWKAQRTRKRRKRSRGEADE